MSRDPYRGSRRFLFGFLVVTTGLLGVATLAFCGAVIGGFR